MSQLHGVETIELTSGTVAVTTIQTAIIGLVGTAPDASGGTAASGSSGTPILDNVIDFTATIKGREGNVINVAALAGQPAAENPAAVVTSASWDPESLTLNITLGCDEHGVITATRGWFGPDSDDEAFNKSLDKYLSPEGGDSLLNWNAALQHNQERVARTNKEGPEDSARAGDKYPNASLLPAGQQERHVTATDRLPVEPVILKDESTGGYWESLLQKMDVLDKQPPSRQITDNRKFEYHFEINAAPGQDEKAIADEVTTVTKNNSAFNGDNSLLDGGLVW